MSNNPLRVDVGDEQRARSGGSVRNTTLDVSDPCYGIRERARTKAVSR